MQTPNTVIVSEPLARRFWPDEDPIGKRIKTGSVDATDPWLTIIGVVRDAKWRGLPRNSTADPDLFFPFPPQSRNFSLLVRTRVPPETVADAVRRAIRAVEPGATTFDVTTMEERVSARTARPRFVSWLMGVFAGLGAAAVGDWRLRRAGAERRAANAGDWHPHGAGSQRR